MFEPEIPKSFVARFWLEGEPGDDPVWRGHIRHVQGDEEGYFQSLSEMSAFLERIGGVPLPPEFMTKTSDETGDETDDDAVD